MTKEQIIAVIVCFMINKNTAKPEGCENLEAECSSCPITTCLKNTSEKEK